MRRLIYPAPTPLSKGIGILPTINGNLLLGPTAVDLDDKEDRSTSTEGMNMDIGEITLKGQGSSLFSEENQL